MPAVASCGREIECEAGDGCVVDCLADLQDGVVGRRGEVEIGREATCAAEAALAQAGAALEDEATVGEEPEL